MAVKIVSETACEVPHAHEPFGAGCREFLAVRAIRDCIDEIVDVVLNECGLCYSARLRSLGFPRALTLQQLPRRMAQAGLVVFQRRSDDGRYN